jgi:LuxR family maltose regulon positive regulatory protein
MAGSAKSVVRDRCLYTGAEQIPVGSPSWYEWLSHARNFSFKGEKGSFVAQCEKRRNNSYWYAYRRAGKLIKAYLGKTEELTSERLERACISLSGQTLLSHLPDQPGIGEYGTSESRIDTSLLPLTKVNVPALPRQLVARPRLTRKINTPLTLIYAPSGFGKSTLLNDWRQSCGHPVAWLSLDESDNHVMRFWQSVTAALQTVDPEFGRDLVAHLGTATSRQLPDVVLRLTNDLVHRQASYPRLGLVLDDFHRIHQTEIYDAIQSLLEHLPPNLQLIILGHTHPPLSLGHLRAKGLLTEMDANDLRFTLEEGIDYLRRYQQETTLAYDDLAKLVRHTEGWAAGLTLTALALSKQENHREFVDTFSGAHIYMREYFMETVLQRSSPDVQAFLLKTAILKHLTGSLCDAVTGQAGSEEMLARLWNENLFIVRLEEQGWYRYHDLFAEMLLSQLEARFPDEISQLHQRAAQWYREQFAPADAIYHLLATQAWEEAALLIEEMALRELEQYGEDSRLLRWVQELPAGVVQKHRTILFVYLRLAYVAVPRQKIEHFISHIENSLSSKPAAQQTPDERDVLLEVQQIRRAWEKGDRFMPPAIEGSENYARWELLNGMQLLRPLDKTLTERLEHQVVELFQRAQIQRNLFLTALTGGSLSRRFFINGQLRRGEKIARQVLEQALAQRGKLPETASVALTTLSQVHLERNEPGLAQRYLDQAMEVDPNPTSTNMLVQSSIQRAEIHIALGGFEEALVNIRSIRDLHLRRPSAMWTDQDLIAYEAFIYVRRGDADAAEQVLGEFPDTGEHGLSRLVRAEILLIRKQADAAETQLTDVISLYPNGILSIPLMRTRLLLAKALFDQYKVKQSLQVIRDAVRLAAPERFIRPFLECRAICIPLLSLTLQTENLTSESQSFIRDVLRMSNHAESDMQVSHAEMEALSASASISPREQEVLTLISAGFSNREIAQKLSISESTVKTHIGNIYSKLNVNSRVQAITHAKELKLV